MDVSIYTAVFTDIASSKAAEIPQVLTEKTTETIIEKPRQVTRLPIGATIRYPWYGKEVVGTILGDCKEFSLLQVASMVIQGVRVKVLVDPAKGLG